jgi:hypothetical protein
VLKSFLEVSRKEIMMDKTTLQILKAIPVNESVTLTDLLNKLRDNVSSSIVDDALPYLNGNGWIMIDSSISSSNPLVSVTYPGLLVIWEAEEDERRYKDSHALAESANTISREANTIAAEANTLSRYANKLSGKANRTSRISLFIAAIAMMIEVVRCSRGG